MVYLWELTHRHRRWSEEDEARLAGMIAAGKTAREIAKAMGRSQESVRMRVAKLALVPARSRKLRSPRKGD